MFFVTFDRVRSHPFTGFLWSICGPFSVGAGNVPPLALWRASDYRILTLSRRLVRLFGNAVIPQRDDSRQDNKTNK